MLNKFKNFQKCANSITFYIYVWKWSWFQIIPRSKTWALLEGSIFKKCYLASKCKLKMQSAFIEVGCKHRWVQPPCILIISPDTHFCNSSWSTFQLKGPWPCTSQVNANPSFTRINQRIINWVPIIKHLFSMF